MSNILLTGACGYLGSRILSHNTTHNIIAVDDLRTQRYCSLLDINIGRHIKFYEHIDYVPEEQWNKIDTVIHFAGTVDAANSFENKGALEQDFNDFQSLCTRCSYHKVKTLVFPSSTSVYGIGGVVKEDDDSALNPQSPYAETKVKIENYLKENPPCDYLILRFGTICGYAPGIRYQTAINYFCYRACIDKPLTVWRENLHQVRPFLSVSQAIDTMDELLKGGHVNQTFNVVTENLTPSQIISMIEKRVKIDIRYVDTPLLNQYSYNVDTTKVGKIYYAQDSIDRNIAQLIRKLGKLNDQSI